MFSSKLPLIFILRPLVPRDEDHSRSCQDVCRYLRPIRWPAILCTYRAVGTAGGLSDILSEKLSLNNPSLGDARVVLQFSRSERHGVFLLYHEVRDGWCVEFLLSQPSCVFCGNTSAVDDAFCPIL